MNPLYICNVFHAILLYIFVPVSVGSRFVGPAAEPRSSSLNQESASFCQPKIEVNNVKQSNHCFEKNKTAV